MKRLLSLTALAFSIMLLASFKNAANAQVRAGISINYQTFYDELDPYGRWIDYPEYGYVWIPDAGPDFRPYSTNGHWVWSDEYDWMWVSDYDWGWAPFHYGRWMEDPYYGWIWVPGYEWSPAWVAWRDGGDYYGWAPLRPGINISIGFNIGGYSCPDDYWSFAPRRYITSPRIYDYCVPRRNNVTIINQTTIINNYNYNRNVFRTGPGRRDAERYAGRINSVRFRDASDPGRARFRGNEVAVYRPSVQRDNNRSFQPRRVQQYDRNGRGDIGRANGNNLPQRQENGNGGFGRRNSENNDNRFRNNDNGNGISGRRNNVISRDRAEPLDNGNARPERPNRQFEPRNNNNEVGETSPSRGRGRNRDNGDDPVNGNGNRRNIFQRNDDPGSNRPIERRNIETQPNERRMERRDVFERNNGNGRQPEQPRQMEQPRQFERPQGRQFEQRRVEQPQQPRQMEQPRRFEQPQNRQSEQRRVEQPQQPRGDQSQGRQFERRNDNNGGGSGGNSGGGHGRRGR
jgi:hypothetical protein